MLVLSIRPAVGVLVYDRFGASAPSVLQSRANPDAPQYRIGLAFDDRFTLIRFDLALQMIQKCLAEPKDLTDDEAADLKQGAVVLQDPEATADTIRAVFSLPALIELCHNYGEN